MSRFALRGTAALILAVPLTLLWTRRGPDAMTLPDPVVDSRSGSTATAVLAGGCFWGIEAVFEHIKGVTNAVSGYAGGSAETADYERVSSGTTGHAEAVQITYDPAQVSYGTLLKVFFSVAHDPTQLNRQGPDIGTQYRSAIFYADEEQERVAKAYIEQLKSDKAFPRPIVTQVVALQKFYPAEEYHQDYMKHNPNQPYILIHDRPKVEHLKKEFPQLYRNN